MKKKEKAEKRAREEYERELKRAREEEEYAKWEQFITLEGEGTDVKEDIFSNQERLESFIDTLRTRKVTDIDEIASEFNMTQEVGDDVGLRDRKWKQR